MATSRAKSTTQTFDAVLETGNILGWTTVRVPFDPAVVWVERIRLRVKGTINGVVFRTSLFPIASKPGTYCLLVNKRMQAEAHVLAGHIAHFMLEADLDPRPAELPEELDVLLDEAEGLREWYDALSENTRRQIGTYIHDAKGDAARVKRAEQIAERSLFAMEGEVELPPSILRAFKSRPKAAAGWKTMTPTQRRMELFAVAAYKSPESVAKRIGKLCDAAEKRVQ
jgi:uncharacterized protein YdeI (YjbR/CyaY-like superfamily)